MTRKSGEGYELAFAGVAGQAALVRSGEVTAGDLVDLALKRIERLDPELNAFVAVYEERARRDAEVADACRRAGVSEPLLGVPFAVKDDFDIAGEVTGHGTDAFTRPADADAVIVRRLRAAGAIIIGKTTMSELGLWPGTASRTCGVTRNPWNTARTPGGSSGGSAAAVAAGLVAGALAADGAGSIRIPAACCGLFGLKPQHGRVPHGRGGFRWDVFFALTRSVADSALLLDVLAGRPGASGGSFVAAARSEPGRLRIARLDVSPPLTGGRLAPEVLGALDRTSELLRSVGHEVVDGGPLLRTREAVALLGVMARGIHDLVSAVERPERLEPRTRALARPGALISDRMLARLELAERELVARIQDLGGHDLLLTPVLARPAEPAHIMEGRGAIAAAWWASRWAPFSALWNATGQPAASIPAGFDDDGLPLAVQLVARPDREDMLLTVAAQLEAAESWTRHRPPLG